MEFKSYAQLIKKVEHSSCLDWAQGGCLPPPCMPRETAWEPRRVAPGLSASIVLISGKPELRGFFTEPGFPEGFSHFVLP